VAEIGQFAAANSAHSKAAWGGDKIFCLKLPYRWIEVSAKTKAGDRVSPTRRTAWRALGVSTAKLKQANDNTIPLEPIVHALLKGHDMQESGSGEQNPEW
jgi:hypothetical protein